MVNHEEQRSNGKKQQVFYGYIIVAIALLIAVMTMGTFYSFGVFFKPLIAEFGWTRATTSSAVSIAWIVSGFLSIGVGGLSDRLGPRKVVTTIAVFSGVGYLLMSQISAIWQLYLFYGLFIGVGLTFYIPLASTVVRWFVKRRTLMSGIVVIGGGLGTLIGPPVANQLILAYDWRFSYLIIGGVYLILVTIASQFLKRDPSQIGKTAYGENEINRDSFNQVIKDSSFKEAIDTKPFWMLFAMVLCAGLIVQAAMIHIAPYATDIGISATGAATILATMGGVSIAGRIALGSIGDMIGNRKAFAIAFVLMLIAYLWLLQANAMWKLYIFAVVFGLAWGGSMAQQAPIVAMLFGLTSHGLIFGLVSLGFSIGGSIGPVLAGYIFDITNRYQAAFMVTASITLVGLILTILLKPPTTRHAEKA